MEDALFLEHIEIHRARRSLAKLDVLCVSDNAYHFIGLVVTVPAARRSAAVNVDMHPDRIAPWKIVSRHALADDRDSRTARVIEREIASREQRNAERIEILRRHPAQRGVAAILGPFRIS